MMTRRQVFAVFAAVCIVELQSLEPREVATSSERTCTSADTGTDCSPAAATDETSLLQTRSWTARRGVSGVYTKRNDDENYDDPNSSGGSGGSGDMDSTVVVSSSGGSGESSRSSSVADSAQTDPIVIWKPSPTPSPTVEVSVPQVVSAPKPHYDPDAAFHQAAVNYQPEHSACVPKCTWQCETKKCDEVCAPVCKPPRCQTRCKGFNTNACHMECAKPHCAVVCPKRICPTGRCPKCNTVCTKPMCKMRCDNAQQPCRSVCAHPECKWQCKAPKDCPRPNCKMICISPKDCLASNHEDLPPLQPGECEVKSFEAPHNLNSLLAEGEPDKTPTMSVPVTTSQEGTLLATRNTQMALAPLTGVPLATGMQEVASSQGVQMEEMPGRPTVDIPVTTVEEHSRAKSAHAGQAQMIDLPTTMID